MVFIFIPSILNSPSLGRMCRKVKACNQIQFFTPKYINTCDELEIINLILFTISNMKRINNKSFHFILLLLSGDISLNQGPKNNLRPFDWTELNVFYSKGLYLIPWNINNLRSKIDELWYIVNSSNWAVIGISESKLDESVL